MSDVQAKTLQEFLTPATMNALCHGCGTCQSICPNSALRLVKDATGATYNIRLTKAKCHQCGSCYKVCPGHSINFDQLRLNIFGEKPRNPLLGNFLDCFLGYSNNPKIRHDSSSGGLITQLLTFALEEKIIDGVLVTKMSADKPLEPEPFIARSAEEIAAASRSKYCPVPANIGLREIMRKEGRYAVVGLPCHMHGIRKAEALNRRLERKVILHMGLFCVHTLNFVATELLLEKFRIQKTDVKELHYRGRGWPGDFALELSDPNRTIVFKDYRKFWNPLTGSFFYTPLRCMSCVDPSNELADISFGDAWLKSVMKIDHEGTSIVISRNQRSAEILRRAEQAGVITLERIDAKKVIKCQSNSIYSKKVVSAARMGVLRKLGIKVPDYFGSKPISDPLLYALAVLELMNVKLSQGRTIYKTLKFMPQTSLRAGPALLYYLQRLCGKTTALTAGGCSE